MFHFSTGVQAVHRRTFLYFYDQSSEAVSQNRCRCSTDSSVRYADSLYFCKNHDESGDESSSTEAGFSSSESWADMTDDEADHTHTSKGKFAVSPRPPGNFASASGSAVAKRATKETDSTRTCVMIRNFPKRFTRAVFMDVLDKAGFRGKYDFLYMPVDFRKLMAIGYAFVNMSSHGEAVRMMQHFEGFQQWDDQTPAETDQIGSVCWSAVQGLSANVERYRNSAVMHPAVPEEYKPLVLRQGLPVSFPTNTKKVRVPRKAFKDL